MIGQLKGKTAIITGAGSGMGRAISKTFARVGAKVVLANIVKEGVEETHTQIDQSGGTSIVQIGDVSKQEDINTVIKTALNEYGQLNILVNNAGIFDKFIPLVDMTD